MDYFLFIYIIIIICFSDRCNHFSRTFLAGIFSFQRFISSIFIIMDFNAIDFFFGFKNIFTIIGLILFFSIGFINELTSQWGTCKFFLKIYETTHNRGYFRDNTSLELHIPINLSITVNLQWQQWSLPTFNFNFVFPTSLGISLLNEDFCLVAEDHGRGKTITWIQF